MLTLLLAWAIFLACILHIIGSWNNYFKQRGFPYFQPIPLAGNALDMILMKLSVAEFLQKLYQKMKPGQPILGFFIGPKPAILLKDLHLMRQIMVKDFDYFPERAFDPDEVNDPVPANLVFFAKGEKYKAAVRRFRPAFALQQVKKLIPATNESVQKLVAKLATPADKSQPINILEFINKFSIDTTLLLGTGEHFDSFDNPENEILVNIKSLCTPSIRQYSAFVMAAMFPRVANFIGLTLVQNKYIDFARKTIAEFYWKRVKSNTKKGDLMDTLIETMKAEEEEATFSENKENASSETNCIERNFIQKSIPNINELSSSLPILPDEWTSYALTFIMSNAETNARATGFALYEMAMNLDVQRKSQEEIDFVLAKYEGKLTYETIQEMRYLDKVVSESLRKHPPFPQTNRKCMKNYNIPGTKLTIEKGMPVFIPILALHYDPQYFPDPYKFDPERFSEEEKLKRPTYCYIPFGAGPRICTAPKFALMIMKTVLVHVLRTYDLYPCEETPLRPRLHPRVVFLEPKDKLIVKLRKRQCTST